MALLRWGGSRWLRGEVGFCPVADVEDFFRVGLERWAQRVPVFALSFSGASQSIIFGAPWMGGGIKGVGAWNVCGRTPGAQ